MGMERRSWLLETLDLGSGSSQVPHDSWTMKVSPLWLSSVWFLFSWPPQLSPVLSVLLISLLLLFFLTPLRGEKYFSSQREAALFQYCYYFSVSLLAWIHKGIGCKRKEFVKNELWTCTFFSLDPRRTWQRGTRHGGRTQLGGPCSNHTLTWVSTWSTLSHFYSSLIQIHTIISFSELVGPC